MLGLRTAWRDTMRVLDVHAGLPLRHLLPQLLGGLAVGVFLYVPVHELLHALGCVAVGGRVAQIEIAPLFGGALLARLSPVVSAETEYAGRLSGFDVGGSDLRLLATDFAPYILTVLIGVPLLRHLIGRPRAWLVPGALLLALAPWISLPGDYYEMGSVLVTNLLARVGVDWSTLRSDDLVTLAASLWSEPAALGVTTATHAAGALIVMMCSVAVGAVLAGATYLLGAWFASGSGRTTP